MQVQPEKKALDREPVEEKWVASKGGPGPILLRKDHRNVGTRKAIDRFAAGTGGNIA